VNTRLQQADITSELVDEFIASHESGWKTFEKEAQLLQQEGIRLIGAIGDGGTNCVPKFISNSSGSSVEKFLDPNTVGAEAYTANMMLYSRAVARRMGAYISVW